jgi:hypothetical protein
MNDKFDSLIDRALASYTPAEPRPGLEQRILASVAAAGHPRTGVWRPAWALAAAAVIVAVVAIPLAFKSMHPTVAVVHPATAAPAEVAIARQSSTAVSAPANPARHAHAHPAASQPAVPEAASKSSLALIATLTIAPIRNQPLTDEAIEFKSITIDPIRIAALN